MIKAVIFDLDNTLIDFMKMKKASCEKAVDAMISVGLNLSKKKALKELYKIYYKEGLEDNLIFQKFLKKVTGEINYKKLAHAIVAYRKARTGFLNPYTGTRKTLKKLQKKGLKLAIVSDAPKLKAWLRLVYMKLDNFFDVVVALEDTGARKPSELPFMAALRQLKLRPDECLMVGDNPKRDIKGAKNLGMKTCFAKYGCEAKKRVKADYVIETIEELINIIKEDVLFNQC